MGYLQVVCISINPHTHFTNHISSIHEYFCNSPLLVSSWPWIKGAHGACEICLLDFNFAVCLFDYEYCLSLTQSYASMLKSEGNPMNLLWKMFLYLNYFFHMNIREISSNLCKWSLNRIICVISSVQGVTEVD